MPTIIFNKMKKTNNNFSLSIISIGIGVAGLVAIISEEFRLLAVSIFLIFFASYFLYILYDKIEKNSENIYNISEEVKRLNEKIKIYKDIININADIKDLKKEVFKK